MRHALRACLATVLALLLGWSGPLSARQAQPPDPLVDWARVVRLRPATRIRLDLVGREIPDVRLLAADADGVLFLDTSEVADRAARRQVDDLARTAPDRLLSIRQPGNAIRSPGLTLSSAGLRLESGQTIDINRVLVRVDKPDVARIATVERPINTGKGIALGLLAGLGLGAIVASQMDHVCYGCGIFPLGGMLFGGFVGRALADPDRHVVYRRQ
jgi:hypothetical protein